MMEYECQNAGCDVGEFEDRDEEWYWDKGLDTPRNCRTCREWKREQVDEVFTCSICGNKRYISRGVKIMHHKNDGPWEDPEWCLPCERDPDRRKDAQNREEGRQAFERAYAQGKHRVWKTARSRVYGEPIERAIHRATQGSSTYTYVEPTDILQAPDAYRQVPYRRGSTGYDHLFGHRSDLEKSLGVGDDSAILEMLQEINHETDPEQIAEFRQPDGRVVKYDKASGTAIVLVPYDDAPPGDMVFTSFPMSTGQVVARIDDGRWMPYV